MSRWVKTVRSITFICAFYKNPGMMREQQRVWREYSRKAKPYFHVIMTDDGSPKHRALLCVEETGIASFRLYRTLVDCRWNWLFCRNLGVANATTDWVLLTDIDHVLPEFTLRRLIEQELDDECVYRFSRKDAPKLTDYKPHPNTWFMTRAMFDRIGGYDERFSGFYGSDGEFRDRVTSTAKAVILRSDYLIRYPREVIQDASTTSYGRKEPQDGENIPRIKAERSLIPDWRPLRLTFPYELQYDSREAACSRS